MCSVECESPAATLYSMCWIGRFLLGERQVQRAECRLQSAERGAQSKYGFQFFLVLCLMQCFHLPHALGIVASIFGQVEFHVIILHGGIP